MGQDRALTDELRRVLVNMDDEERALLQARNAGVQAQAHNALALLSYGIPGTLVILALIGFVLRRDIAPPLTGLSHVAGRMATGDLSLSVPAHQRRDEVGVWSIPSAICCRCLNVACSG